LSGIRETARLSASEALTKLLTIPSGARDALRRLIAPPVFEGDEERTLLASLLQPILLSTLLGVTLYAAIAPVHRQRLALAYVYCGTIGALATVLLVATRRGHVRASARALVAGVWLALVSGAAISGGVLAAAFSGLLIDVLFAGVLLGPGSALLTAGLSVAAGALMLIDPQPPPGAPENVRNQAFLATAVYMLVAAVLLSAVMRAMRVALARAREEARVRRAALVELGEAQARRDELIHQLEAKNAELEGFTYTVSHDLRSPLVTIKGFVAHLATDLQAGDAVRARSDLARIQGAADKMDRLLQELLELSRVGRIVRPPSDLALEDVVHEALFLSQGQLAARSVSVDVATALPRVWGDRARLVQVLQNLVENAVKFMGDQPEPRITIGQRPGQPPVLFVRDNGIGISEEQREAVFTLFRKLDPHAEGSGIGLALVRRIVEAHGGRVWAESEGSGAGATFCFTLPGGSPRQDGGGSA
jgi:signal transduction histidine kinase